MAVPHINICINIPTDFQDTLQGDGGSPASTEAVPQSSGDGGNKWGFVPGDDDTLELDLKRKGAGAVSDLGL